MLSDPVLKKLVKKYPEPDFRDKSERLFESLIESVVSQQLSVKAADTIFGRFKKLFNNSQIVSSALEKTRNDEVDEILRVAQNDKENKFPTPLDVKNMDTEKIRAAGISYQKISYLKSIADAFISDLIDIQKIRKMSDEKVIEALTQIRGIGRWTAEMTLIFTLNRPDVFSYGDLGLRNAIKNLYGITEKDEIMKLAESWSPNRSLASWYLWRSLENV